MKLKEIFDSESKIDWQQNGRFELAGFVSDEKYVIQIERKKFYQFPELINAKAAEVSFFRYDVDNPDAAHSTTPQSIQVPVKVYGIVFNALKSKYADYEAFFFIAAKKHSKSEDEFNSKKTIYAALADRMAKRLSDVYYYENETADAAEFLISKIKLSDETKNQTNIKNPLSEALKITGIHKGFY